MRAITILLSILLAGPALAQDSLLCVAESATGFAFGQRDGDWDVAAIPADGLRYIVSAVEPSSERYRMGYRSVIQDINNDGAEKVRNCSFLRKASYLRAVLPHLAQQSLGRRPNVVPEGLPVFGLVPNVRTLFN